MPCRDDRRAGFTLLEILIALVLGGMVLLSAHELFTDVADRAHALAARAVVLDRDSNGVRLLRLLVGRLEVGTPASGPFAGTPTGTSFTSWCDVPAGWLERCRVTLGFDMVNEEPALVARLNSQAPLVLVRGFGAGSLRYLNSAATGGHWFRSWGQGITAPLALGIILDRDTLIVRIGARG